LAGRFGNQMLLGGFDLTFDCSGNGEGLSDALKWTRPRGAVVVVGTSGITFLETTPIWFDELSVIGANGRQVETVGNQAKHDYALVLDWLAAGRLNLCALPVTRYHVADYRQALGALLSRGRHGIVKAAFQP
jgi:threonine 3-dehydrogenase